MKRFLHAGERYAQSLSLEPTSIYIKHTQTHSTDLGEMRYASTFAKVTRAFALVALFCLTAMQGAEAQIAKAHKAFKDYRKELVPAKYYQIGDKLPKNFVIGYNPFDSTEVFNLNDFKGKAVILDIWATWCGSCISAFPKVDNLGKVYSSQIAILLINLQGERPPFGDNPEVVRKFLTKYKESNPGFSAPFFIEKKPIQESFFFTGLPHYIWIDRNRRVRAITTSKEVTGENIESLFLGRPMDLPIKKR